MDPSPALVLFFTDSTTAADRDRLVALLADFGLLAIQEDDVVRPEKWVAHFKDQASRDAAAHALRASAAYSDLVFEQEDVEDEAWAQRTQADLPAIRIGRIVVAPPWDAGHGIRDQGSGIRDRGSGIGDSLVIVIDPSRGFGTGHHQSTRLCLVLLQSRELSGRTVIDVGTGSGVLAIAAAKLGAAFVAAIDTDPDAIENARENIARNGVASIVEAHVADLSETRSAPADVVTANLTGSLLGRHAPDLARLVRTGGVLIAAGFTVDERDMVARAFEPGMSVGESAEEDGWWGFVLSGRLDRVNSQPPTPNSQGDW